MSILTRRWAVRIGTAASAVSVAALAGLLFFGGLGSGAGEGPILSLSSVSTVELKEKGIELHDPGTMVTPKIGASEAPNRAGTPGAVPQEIVLARLVMKELDPPVDKLVWAVAFDPKTVVLETFGGQVNSDFYEKHPEWAKTAETRVLYAVSFVDAETGEELYFVTRRETTFPGLTPGP